MDHWALHRSSHGRIPLTTACCFQRQERVSILEILVKITCTSDSRRSILWRFLDLSLQYSFRRLVVMAVLGQYLKNKRKYCILHLLISPLGLWWQYIYIREFCFGPFACWYGNSEKKNLEKKGLGSMSRLSSQQHNVLATCLNRPYGVWGIRSRKRCGVKLMTSTSGIITAQTPGSQEE